jgi:NCAIR mutase (PurE)-related protein
MPQGDVFPDIHRRERLGFDEAIYCETKDTDQIRRILLAAEARSETVLLTRLDRAQVSGLPPEQQDRLDYDALSRTGFYGAVAASVAPARVALLSAGTSDVRVAREAARTLLYHGELCHEIYDVGVAGLWRVLERVEEVRRLPVAIVVAGMDAALPSVVAGLVPGAIIAVPVSTGYGVAAGGYAALNAALSSCAPGLVVVNIDNGYGAACAALRILSALPLR